jgi:hypothetical protein
METEAAHPVEFIPDHEAISYSNVPRIIPTSDTITTRAKSKSDAPRCSRLRQAIVPQADETYGTDEFEEAKDVIVELPIVLGLLEPDRRHESPTGPIVPQDTSSSGKPKSHTSISHSAEHSFSDAEEPTTPVIKRKIGTFMKKHFPKLNHEERSNQSLSVKTLATLDLSRNNSESSISEKYGKRESVVGRGAHATVRLAHKREKDAKWFAIKEFRRRKKDESEKDYIKKLIAEFCIRYKFLIKFVTSSPQHCRIN